MLGPAELVKAGLSTEGNQNRGTILVRGDVGRDVQTDAKYTGS